MKEFHDDSFNTPSQMKFKLRSFSTADKYENL
jgi:hypothetical protein